MENLIQSVSGKPSRILYGIPGIIFGLFHFAGAENMAAIVPIPGGVFWVYLTGLFLVAGSLGLILNVKGLGKLAAFLFGVLIFTFAFSIHLPGIINAANEQAGTMSMMMFLKDIMVAAGAWGISSMLE
jgi:putative oxidoreductase